MNQILLEVIRQKKTVILVVLLLIVVNLVFMVVIASYQEPSLAVSRSKWSELRNLVARAGHADAATLHRRGMAARAANS